MNYIKSEKLFCTTTELNFEEYYRYSLQLVNKYCFSLTIITSALVFIVGTLAGIIFQSTLIEVAFWEFVVAVGCGIYYRISHRKSMKKQYDDYCKDGYLDKKSL